MGGRGVRRVVGNVVKSTPAPGFGCTGVTVRRAAIASAIIVTAVFTASSALPASTRLDTADRALSRHLAKTKKPLTKAQYIAKADALCDAAAAAFGPVKQQFQQQVGNSQPTPQVIAAFVKAVVPIVQHQIDKTRALLPPKRDQSKVKKILRAEQAALEKVKADPQKAFGQKKSPFFAADSLARAYGLEGAAGSSACTGAGQASGSGESQGSGGGQGGGGASPPAAPAQP